MSAKKLPDPPYACISPIGSQFPCDLHSPAPETVAGAIIEEDTRLNLFPKKDELFSDRAQLIRWGINE